jgi:hypothetical protein
MDLEKLMSRYFRLRQELSIAYKARPWQSSSIDRLANDLALTEREIAARQSARPHGKPELMAERRSVPRVELQGA